MLFNSPLSSSKADLLVGLLPLEPGGRAIDVGCGTGEFLLHVVEAHGVHGVGVDIHAASMETAKEKASSRGCVDKVEFLKKDIRKLEWDEPFDCGICMGATHAYAMDEPAYSETLKGLGGILKPGGTLLVGESFWEKEPAQVYVDFVGEPSGTYRTHRENVELAEQYGFRILYATTSNLDEWDDFEWRHHMRIEEMARENPDDPEAIKKRDHGQAWRTAYLKWGRGTLGFGFYLFRKEY